jgi:hypothetical protein
MPVISILAEGTLDEAVAKRIVRAAGGQPATPFPKDGAHYIEKKIQSYNRLAQGMPILTLVDLMDVDPACPPEAVREWLPHRHEQMLLRFVVREIESWILADRTSVSRFLGIRKSKIPHHPEELDDPKASFMECARASPKDGLKNALVPDDPTVRAEGPAYTNRMERFVRKQWNLERAMQNAPSLQRSVRAVETILEEREQD